MSHMEDAHCFLGHVEKDPVSVLPFSVEKLPDRVSEGVGLRSERAAFWKTLQTQERRHGTIKPVDRRFRRRGR